MYAYVRRKFQFSGIILTSFRQVLILLPTPKQTFKKPSKTRVKSVVNKDQNHYYHNTILEKSSYKLTKKQCPLYINNYVV